MIVYSDSCTEFIDDANLDSKWKAAISLQAVSWAVAVFLIVLSFAAICFDCGPPMYLAMGFGWIFICTIFTGLIFLVLDSRLCTNNPVIQGNPFLRGNYRDECTLGRGSVSLILAICGFFVTGLSMCAMGASGMKKSGDSSDDKVITQLEEAEMPVDEAAGTDNEETPSDEAPDEEAADVETPVAEGEASTSVKGSMAASASSGVKGSMAASTSSGV